jgi:hypothetical protein
MTRIFWLEGYLSFHGDTLATKQQYELADRCVGSVFEALNPKELILLEEGQFLLDPDLDLIGIQDVLKTRVNKPSQTPVPEGCSRIWFSDGISVGSGFYDCPNQLLGEASSYFWEDEEEPRRTSGFAKASDGSLMIF